MRHGYLFKAIVLLHGLMQYEAVNHHYQKASHTDELEGESVRGLFVVVRVNKLLLTIFMLLLLFLVVHY